MAPPALPSTMRTSPSERVRESATESDSLPREPSETRTRSTTTSMSCFFFLSRTISSSSGFSSPSTMTQEPQVVVDLGDGAGRGPGVLPDRLLLDGDGGGEPFDRVDVGLLHLLEELACVGGKGLDVPALPLRVDRVEGQRRLPRPRYPGDHDAAVPGDLHVGVFQVVLARAAHEDPGERHGGYPRTPAMAAARRIAARRLLGLATPFPAMSEAGPWATEAPM